MTDPLSLPEWRFPGAVVAVTGAASGIGAACVRLFADAGATVGAIDVRFDDPPDSTDAVVPLVADVTDAGAIDGALDELVARAGRLDVLVNNAGIFRAAPVIQTTDELWHEMVAVNLTGVFHAARAAARIMVASGQPGRIVNVSSQHAAVSEPNGGAYTATKAGVEGFTRTLAAELAPSRITVNCVRPGATWSNLTKPIYTPEVIKALTARIPLGVIAEPDWIAQGIAFFASGAGRFATGTTLALDGGYIMDGSLPGVAYE